MSNSQNLSGFSGGMDEDDPFLRPPWEDLTEEDDRGPSVLLGEPFGRSNAKAPWNQTDSRNHVLRLLSSATASLVRLDAVVGSLTPEVQAAAILRIGYAEAVGWLGFNSVNTSITSLALWSKKLLSNAQVVYSPRGKAFAGGWFDTDPLIDEFGDKAPASVSLDLATATRFIVRSTKLALSSTTLPVRYNARIRLALKDVSGVRLNRDAFTSLMESAASTPAGLLAAGDLFFGWAERGCEGEAPGLQASLVAWSHLRQEGMLRTAPLPFWRHQVTTSSPVVSGHLPSLRPDLKASSKLIPGVPDWLETWLYSVDISSKSALADTLQVSRSYDAAINRLGNEHARSKSREIYLSCLKLFAVTPSIIATEVKITQDAALRGLLRLEMLGLIREVTGRKSFRAFVPNYV